MKIFLSFYLLVFAIIANAQSTVVSNSAKPNTVVSRIVASRGYPNGGGNVISQSDGVLTGSTYRYKHWVTADSYGFQVTYSNSAFETNGPNDIVIKCGLEDSLGNIFPVFFNGQRSITVKPGGIVTSDRVGMAGVKGDFIWSRTYVSVTSGERWQKCLVHHATLGEGVSTSDMADSGTVPAALGFGFSPDCITGQTKYTTPNILVVGDSIGAGNKSEQGGIGLYDAGYPVCALGTNNMNSTVGWMNISTGGLKCSDFILQINRRQRGVFMNNCTHAIVQLGINDAGSGGGAGQSFATMQANFLTLWNLLKNQYGLKVYQCTITPATSSTDSFTTVDNQTFANAGNNAVRIQFNNWIRTNPAPLSGYFEIADIAESARDSGKWKIITPGQQYLTNDGLHSIRSDVLSTGINKNLFIVAP